MSDILIGVALLECSTCHNKKQISIFSSKENYGHDYTALMNMGHICNKEKNIVGKYDVKYIQYSEHVNIVSNEDTISFIHPPLTIDWSSGENKEDDI